MAVDDEGDIVRVFKSGLERAGFQVDVHDDPEEALRAFRPGMYDMLLLDIRMPGMSGFELYEKLKKRDERVRVCFLSAFETYDKKIASAFPDLDEVNCFLKKPIAIEDLVKRIAAVLEPG
jgi:two-component system response regulator ChvI